MPEITIEGLSQLQGLLGKFPERADKAVHDGLLAAAAVVQARAKEGVHSDDNPWHGSSDPHYHTPTGKLRSSIGIGNVTGSGLAQEVEVGHPQGMAISAFGRSVAGSSHRVNKGDVEVYGPIEEARHPFLQPALEQETQFIADTMARRIAAVLEGG